MIKKRGGVSPEWDPRGGTRNFKWRGQSKDFFGFEIFDSGIFLGTKIWLGKLDLSRDFLGVLKRIRWGKGYIQMVWWINKHEWSISNVFLCAIALPLSGTFKGHKISMGFFFLLIFRPGIFWGFAGSPRDSFGSWLLAPFDHPHHLKSRVPPWEWD